MRKLFIRLQLMLGIAPKRITITILPKHFKDSPGFWSSQCPAAQALRDVIGSKRLAQIGTGYVQIGFRDTTYPSLHYMVMYRLGEKGFWFEDYNRLRQKYEDTIEFDYKIELTKVKEPTP